MSAEPPQQPALTRLEQHPESEPEVIDFDAVDVTHAVDGTAAESFGQAGPEMIVLAFRAMLKEKLKRWFVRSLIWATILLYFVMEGHTWARWVFGIWAFFAGVHLAFLLYGWRAGARHVAKLTQLFGGAPAASQRRG